MAEQNNMEMVSSLLGEQDALQMLQRVERLKKLMGNTVSKAPSVVAEKQEKTELFSRSRQENMISAALPFLDREYQKELYIIVRLMEMRRVLSGDLLEVRERQEEAPAIRRRKMLHAIQPYLPSSERQQMENMLKMMDMKRIMEGEGIK